MAHTRMHTDLIFCWMFFYHTLIRHLFAQHIDYIKKYFSIIETRCITVAIKSTPQAIRL